MPHSLPWWHGAIIYQVYPRSFFDSNGDGIGDLTGVMNKLDYIAELGVDAIWLSPFFTSPQRDFGYDVADYLDVDPVYGTLNDFDALVARAHSLGLKVIIDQVWGHTSIEHAWFRQSRVSQCNAKSDWYVWADPAPDGTPPNNWLAVFGGSAWTWEPRRRQYYLHHFLADQPCLNFNNEEVLNAVLDTGRFWLDRGVDGFRLDAIDFLSHDVELRDNPISPCSVIPAKPFGMQRHVWDVLQPERYEIYRAIRRLMDEYPGTTTIGEVSSQPGAFERVVDYTTGDDKLHMAYTLGHMRGPFDWPSLHALVKSAATIGSGHVCWSFSNHDTTRAISRWKPAEADTKQFASLLLHLLLALPGSICLYQGEELGLTEANLTYDQLRDPFGITYWPEFKGRDGSRTPLPWNDHRCEDEVSWLPLPDEHLELAVSRQDLNPDSILNLYRRALTLRTRYSAFRHGSFHLIDLPEPLIGFIREDGNRVLCLFNLSGAPAYVDTPWFSGPIDGFEHKFLVLPTEG